MAFEGSAQGVWLEGFRATVDFVISEAQKDGNLGEEDEFWHFLVCFRRV